ncbi:MAG: bifunctional nuclease family protein [Chloroflexi bacterium]|nr:bifunctional nuclease family protein [Chloroflexota bacterium]
MTSFVSQPQIVSQQLLEPETEYTLVQFQNVVITGIPTQPTHEGDEAANWTVPTPALMFKDGRGREISIIIRQEEARTFKEVLEGHPERALLYDLLTALLGKLNIRIEGTFVHDLTDYRYLAKLRLKMQGDDQRMELACRPSDGLLLSILSNCPIYVKNELMDEFSIDIAEILGQR